MPNKKGQQRETEQTEREDCICEGCLNKVSNRSKFSIFCEECKNWYHNSIGLKVRLAAEQDFICQGYKTKPIPQYLTETDSDDTIIIDEPTSNHDVTHDPSSDL